MFIRFVATGALFCSFSVVIAAQPEAKPKPAVEARKANVDGLALFKGQVRGILHEKCLKCHGGKSVKGDFDLSSREKLMDSGFVEATAKDSHLVKLIEHAEEPHMPFKAPKLLPKSIAAIRKWIDLGAPYDKPLVEKTGTRPPMKVTDEDRQFWSFRPLQMDEPPKTKLDSWTRTPADRFIAAKLIEKGLTPNKTASRRVLIRRAYFNLLGLPPSPEEVAAFEQDKDPQAWPKLIDRLLESSHFGERWARHWMDVARFGESFGGEHDYYRPNAYHYRDFLIKAFNEDMPFDQFARWQLAGDELAPGNSLANMATGFLSAGTFPTQLTEAEFESARYDELDDMVTTTGVAFLGLSIGCARCHDHKFDPIPTRDYYRIVAAFGKAIRCETDIDLQPKENLNRKAAWESELARLEKQAADFEKTNLATKFRSWLKDYKPGKGLSAWEDLSIESVTSTAGTKFERQADGSWLAAGNAPAKEVITVVATTKRQNLQAIRLEALTHDSFPRKGPGRAVNGNFALGSFQVTAQPPSPGSAGTVAILKAARATHQQNGGSLSVAASIDQDPISGWAVDQGGIGKDQAAVFDFASPVGYEGGTRLTIELTFNHPNTKHTIGRFRLGVTDRQSPKAELGNAGPSAEVVNALNSLKKEKDLNENSPKWKTALAWFATTVPDAKKLQEAIVAHRKKGPQLKLTKIMLASEGLPKPNHHANGRGYPHFYEKTFLLNRGDANQKGEVSQPGFLQVLSPAGRDLDHFRIAVPEGWKRSNFERASFANWMTDAKEGAGQLVARVIVNRLWHHHFGRGIVATPNDFGFPGDRPTHPKLLDWLADDLIRNGWKLKRLHKLMLTSAVFMQSSEFDEERAKIDPENALLWRRIPRRLEAEAIRDAMLAISGQLDKTMFGPGTLDQNSKRRSVYFTVKRSQLVPMMMLFDWPEHMVSIGRRSTTTIAPQALMFMNSPQGRAYAQATGKRVRGDDLVDSIAAAYLTTLSRKPTADESVLALKFVDSQKSLYGNDANATDRAVTDLCQMLLASSEFVFID
jgi:hypothetical protein